MDYASRVSILLTPRTDNVKPDVFKAGNHIDTRALPRDEKGEEKKKQSTRAYAANCADF